MRACSVLRYPPLDSDGFEFEYFRDSHVPMFAAHLGENCERFEVHRGLATPDAPPPPFVAAAYFWVTSPQALGEVLAEPGSAIYSDIATFSQTQPVRGWAELSYRGRDGTPRAGRGGESAPRAWPRGPAGRIFDPVKRRQGCGG